MPRAATGGASVMKGLGIYHLLLLLLVVMTMIV